MKTNNNMKQSILRASTKLITKKGIKNTSLADIAKAVGISKGTLYYHYSSKDDIVCDIADIHLNIVTNAVLTCVQNMKSENPNNDSVKFIMDKISRIGKTGRVHMYLICEAITCNDTLKERIKLKYIEWRTTYKYEIQHTLGHSEKDSEALSFLIISIVDGLIVQSLLKTEEIDFESISSFLVDRWI